jgi:hypothetical protein
VRIPYESLPWPEPREQAGRYLEGLLGPIERKNGWQLAEHLGDARPWRTQRVLSHVLWDEAAARDLCREHAVGRLGAEDAVLVVDETAFVKKGEHSAGVARQYCGTLGKVENSLMFVVNGFGREATTSAGLRRRGVRLMSRRAGDGAAQTTVGRLVWGFACQALVIAAPSRSEARPCGLASVGRVTIGGEPAIAGR